MKLRLTFYIVLFFFSTTLIAQQSLSLSFGMDLAGLGFGYKFRENGNVLQRGGAGYYEANVAFYSKLKYRLGSYFGLEASYSLVEYDLGVHDVKYLRDNNLPTIDPGTTGAKFEGQPGYLGAYKYYSSPGFGLYGFIPLYREDEHTIPLSVYVSSGILFNKRKGAQEYRNSYRNNAKNEELLLVTKYANYFNTGYCEAGLNYISKAGIVFDIGLKYVFGGAMMEADYTNIANGTLISSDNVTAGSSYFALAFNIGYRFWHKPKRIKDDRDSKPQLQLDAEIEPTDTITNEKDVYSRPLEIANTLNVSGEKVTIIVWDDGTVDGDIISLNLNGDWILNEYTLTAEKQEINITLKPGDNKLVLYTESEGRHKPCTAAIKVVDNKIVQWVVLKSDLKKSSCLILKSGE